MTILILALLLAGTAALVAAIMWIMARFGGWRELSLRYPSQPSTGPYRRGLTSMRLRGIAGYNNCILWRADDHYLHLRLMPPFNIFHSPISIPWEEIDLPESIGRWTARLRAGEIPMILPAGVLRRSLEVIAVPAGEPSMRDAVHDVTA
jgi:hypothetical protein